MKHQPILPLSDDELACFWSKVAKCGPDDCWLWQASKNEYGRGHIWIHGKCCWASRIAYYAANGHDPGELEVCHTCDNPSCCNPAHLWLVTHAENMSDRDRKGRACGGKQSGEMNPLVRLSSDAIARIRASSEPSSVLARFYGVTRSHINSIRAGRRWKQLQSDNPTTLLEYHA